MPTIISRVHAAAALALALTANAQTKPLPPGAPSATCDTTGARDVSNLRVISGTAPVPYVFACGQNRPAGTCARDDLKPGSPSFPTTALVGLDRTQGAWSCIFADGVSGWVPSDRLAPPPATPAIHIADWLGSWRDGSDTPGYPKNRLYLTRSATNPRVIHVRGQAFWSNGNPDNVHDGEIDADAVAIGPYLHVVDGDDATACILDLTFNPSTHTFDANDNSLCGGVNVRFAGTWTRYAATAPPPRPS